MINTPLVRTSIVLLCFFLCIACEEEKPKDVLSEDKMTEVMLEVFLGEGKVSALNIKRDSALTVFSVYEKRVFDKYAVDPEVYKKSMTYYYDHPDLLEKVYERVLDSLNVKEQKLKEKTEAKLKGEEDKEDRSEQKPGSKDEEKSKERE